MIKIEEMAKLSLSQETKVELMRAKSEGIEALLIEIQDDFEFDTATAYFSKEALDEFAYLNWLQKPKVLNWLKDRNKFFQRRDKEALRK